MMECGISLKNAKGFYLDKRQCKYNIDTYCWDVYSLTTILANRGFRKFGLEKALTDFILGFITESGCTFSSLQELSPVPEKFRWLNNEGRTVKASISLLLLEGKLYFVLFDEESEVRA